MARAITDDERPTPHDLAEAEAIAAGTCLRPIARRHVVALFLELQRVRLAKDHQADFIRAQREGFVLRIEQEGATTHV